MTGRQVGQDGDDYAHVMSWAAVIFFGAIGLGWLIHAVWGILRVLVP